MDKELYEAFRDDRFADLAEEYFDKHPTDKYNFEQWCMNKFIDHEADKAEHIHEQLQEEYDERRRFEMMEDENDQS